MRDVPGAGGAEEGQVPAGQREVCPGSRAGAGGSDGVFSLGGITVKAIC